MPKVTQRPEPVTARLLALDTETTGLDVRHGARPYFVTTCDEEGRQRFWEWEVDPLTRAVAVPEADRREIAGICSALGPPLVGQNIKFDVAALASIGVDFHWGHVQDTLVAGHLLHSGQPHDLTSMALMMTGEDVQSFEDALEDACNAARRLCRSKLPAWRIAKEGLPEMPSARSGSKRTKRGAESESPWKSDAWLPKAVAREMGWREPAGDCDHAWAKCLKLPGMECRHCRGHRWWVVTRDYANKDSETTLRLWLAQRDEIERRGLGAIYRERLKILPIVADMEARGVTVSLAELERLLRDHGALSARLGEECVELARAKGYELELPKGASPNGSLRTFCFDVLDLERRYGSKSKTPEPSLDKHAMAHYKATLDPATDAGRFVNALLDKRKLDTGIAYMESYRKFAVPVEGHPGFARLHPSVNPTGTVGLRFSMSNPNGQNVSTQEDEEGAGVRDTFCPLPGREFWDLDYSNLELRIPAHEAGERIMIDLFEHPDAPPYYGSYHLLVAHKLFPKEFEEASRTTDGHLDGRLFKERCKQLYKTTKNTDLAAQYGAQKATADRTAKRAGAFEVLQGTFPKTFELSARYVRRAEEHGFVETIPDRTVGDGKRGFPVETQRSEWGRISPTEPFNYHVQSTAGQAINKAMTSIAPVLAGWERATGRPHFIALQVHDSLLFDFPAGGRRNLPKVEALRAIMERSGEDIGIPLRVSVSWHPKNWGKVEDVHAVVQDNSR